MGMFDQGARYACRVHPSVVARKLLRQVRERLSFGQFHESKTNPLPGQRERIADSVLALDNLGAPSAPCLMLLEFQSRHDEDKLQTTFVSVAHLRADVRHGPDRKGRYEVFAGLVYLQGKAVETEIGMALTDADGKQVAGSHHQALLWEVGEDDADAALAEVGADFAGWWGLLFWVPLMRGGSLAQNVTKWLSLVTQVTSQRHRADLGQIALIFAELAGTLREWREALEGFDMEDSQVVLEWTAKAREEAEVVALQRTLLRLAQKRFKGELKDEEKEMISSQESKDVLAAWLDAVVEQATYADFRAVLRR